MASSEAPAQQTSRWFEVAYLAKAKPDSECFDDLYGHWIQAHIPIQRAKPKLWFEPGPLQKPATLAIPKGVMFTIQECKSADHYRAYCDYVENSQDEAAKQVRDFENEHFERLQRVRVILDRQHDRWPGIWQAHKHLLGE